MQQNRDQVGRTKTASTTIDTIQLYIFLLHLTVCPIPHIPNCFSLSLLPRNAKSYLILPSVVLRLAFPPPFFGDTLHLLFSSFLFFPHKKRKKKILGIIFYYYFPALSITASTLRITTGYYDDFFFVFCFVLSCRSA
jgi:hypothetical protein